MYSFLPSFSVQGFQLLLKSLYNFLPSFSVQDFQLPLKSLYSFLPSFSVQDFQLPLKSLYNFLPSFSVQDFQLPLKSLYNFLPSFSVQGFQLPLKSLYRFVLKINRLHFFLIKIIITFFRKEFRVFIIVFGGIHRLFKGVSWDSLHFFGKKMKQKFKDNIGDGLFNYETYLPFLFL
ncbi:hypothetical protein B9C57_04830 [Tenacibaculum maritimum]|nr:hypothetical protein B9C57_04830 [Tenacibaculum maritimum]